jgi:hypothetical protein
MICFKHSILIFYFFKNLIQILGYPDSKPKAEKGDPGTDGKPGLPGYNAGNLIISTYETLYKEKLKFIAQGGQGGPGQEG